MSSKNQRAEWERNPSHVAILLKELLTDSDVDPETIRKRHNIIKDRYDQSQVYTKLGLLKSKFPTDAARQEALKVLESPKTPSKTNKVARGVEMKKRGAKKLKERLRKAGITAESDDSESDGTSALSGPMDVSDDSGECSDESMDEFEAQAKSKKRPFLPSDLETLVKGLVHHPLYLATAEDGSRASSSPPSDDISASTAPATYAVRRYQIYPCPEFPFRVVWGKSLAHMVLYVCDLPRGATISAELDKESAKFVKLIVKDQSLAERKAALLAQFQSTIDDHQLSQTTYITTIDLSENIAPELPRKKELNEDGVYALRFATIAAIQQSSNVIKI